MNAQPALERRYRRLLAWYPAAFRREHEEEMVAVLMVAGHGRRRPGIADSANLVWHGSRLRVAPRTRRSVPSVYWAVRLMLLAAGLELAAMVVVIASQGAVKASVLRHFTGLSAAHSVSLVHGQVLAVEIGAPIAAAAWLVLAWANDRGHRWGRVGAIVLLALTSMSLLTSVARQAGAFAPADLAIGTALWVVALAGSALLFHHRLQPALPPVSPWQGSSRRELGSRRHTRRKGELR